MLCEQEEEQRHACLSTITVPSEFAENKKNSRPFDEERKQQPSALTAPLAVSASASCMKKEGTKACGRN